MSGIFSQPCHWSKTGTMGTLSSQADFGVLAYRYKHRGACSPAHSLWPYWGWVGDWVVPSRCRGPGYYPLHFFEFILFAAALHSYAFLKTKNFNNGNVVLLRSCNFFNNGNGVSTRSPRNYPWVTRAYELLKTGSKAAIDLNMVILALFTLVCPISQAVKITRDAESGWLRVVSPVR